jgi:hypothetical protein
MQDDRERPQREFGEGLRNIKRAIVEALGNVQIRATDADIGHEPNWEHGEGIPDVTVISIRPSGAPLVRVEFSRAQIEDSWRNVERPEVIARVRAIAEEYRRLRDKR